MKMVKSLLLGSAAGLVAVTAGQAADLPVKAKPVEYVKVCSLYGAGFYYIPGTDVCIKIGGFVRTEINVHAQGSFAPFVGNNANSFQTRSEDNYLVRARTYLTADVREQTSYGTLRGYLAAGWQYGTDDAPTLSLPAFQATGTSTHVGTALATTFAGGGNNNVSILRAFIQLGGFTFGKTASFYDFFNTSKYSLQSNFIYQDFAGVGIFTYGYTQTLGNGFAFTIAGQDPSPFENNIVDVNPAPAAGPFAFSSTTATAPTVNLGTTSNVFLPGAANDINNAGTLVPDFVATLRVDQAWGGGQVAVIAHDNRALYYNTSALGVIKGSDHPDDKWGFAVMAGIELNLPWAKGDSLAVQGQYCDGASYACYQRSGNRFVDNGWQLVNVNRVGLGWVDDAFYASPSAATATAHAISASGLQLSTTWNVWAAIQHYWVPEVRTSLYGGYVNYKAGSSEIDTLICAPLNAGHAAQGIIAQTPGAVAATGCADWAAWAIGSRTLWNPTKNLDVGVDVLYTAMAKSAFSGATIGTLAAGTPATLTVGDTHIWAGILRVQYNFYP